MIIHLPGDTMLVCRECALDEPVAKAVLKTPQSKRWRGCQATLDDAKRLDCGAFTAALPNPNQISVRVSFRRCALLKGRRHYIATIGEASLLAAGFPTG